MIEFGTFVTLNGMGLGIVVGHVDKQAKVFMFKHSGDVLPFHTYKIPENMLSVSDVQSFDLCSSPRWGVGQFISRNSTVYLMVEKGDLGYYAYVMSSKTNPEMVGKKTYVINPFVVQIVR